MRAEYMQSLTVDERLQSAEALMEIDRKMLSAGSLLRSDKLLMAAGVEGRVPLLDLEMIRLAKRIPTKYKVSLFDTKVIFKEAMKENLPRYLFQEKKRGWITPTGVWLREPMIQKYIHEVLCPEFYQGTAALFNWSQVEKIIQDHYDGKQSYRAQIWALLAFQVWARRFNVTP
jgi:asparagine synthase (glutamine-hydrolysing)